ncbi:MAG: dihydrofolate reductase family protein [Albimonas sp.]|uniref:dihydrofolate reductase family protein n=1 Tax=Albimonas sp. TaxID=1872425 RepID=UPI0040564C53
MPAPSVVCHMIASLDGRLLTRRWGVAQERLLALYDAAAERLDADGWMAGRETMQDYLEHGPPALAEAPPAAPRPDRIAAPGARRVGVAFDRHGRLRPGAGEIDGDHLVVAVSEQVCEAHVARLAAQGVSVIFAGPQGEDIPRVLARLGEVFGLRRVLLEGGGRLNAAFLAADAIDETSTLIYPVLDGQRGVPAIYDDPGAARPRRLELIGAETLEGGVPWLRHRVLRD